MLKITITAVKSIKLGYRLLIEIQIIHFSPKSHYDPGLNRKLKSKKKKAHGLNTEVLGIWPLGALARDYGSNIWANITTKIFQKKSFDYFEIGLLQLVKRPSKQLCLNDISLKIYNASNMARNHKFSYFNSLIAFIFSCQHATFDAKYLHKEISFRHKCLLGRFTRWSRPI